jgi:transaldolase
MDTKSRPCKLDEMRLLRADWWNDSCDLAQLAEAVSKGATGATSNPVIVEAAVNADKETWLPVVRELARNHPQESAAAITWRLIATIGRQAAEILLPIHEQTKGEKGYLSLQVNPKNHLDPEKMFQQAVELASIAPNIAIKLPTTEAGLAVAERLVGRGIPVNTTVSFSVAQAVAAAEAIERGLKTFALEGGDVSKIHPYVTIMVGRVGDYLKRIAAKDGVELESENAITLSGVYVFRKAARIFEQRGFQSTLLAAAYRHELQWSQIIGKHVLQSIPYDWWRAFSKSDFVVRETINDREDLTILTELREKFPDFSNVYQTEGLTVNEFQEFEATVNTLDQFISGYEQLLALIEGAMKNV